MQTSAPRRVTRWRVNSRPTLRVWQIAGGIATVALVLLTHMATGSAANSGLFGLFRAQHEFLEAGSLATSQTTAVVDTTPPGTVYLPGYAYMEDAILPGVVVLRPGRLQAAAAVPEGQSANGQALPPTELLGFGSDGRMEMRELSGWRRAGAGEIRALAWTGDGEHLIVALAGEVQVYGLTANGLRMMATVAVAGVSDLAPGPGRSFWLLDGMRVRHFAWDGSGYRELPAWQIDGLSAPVAISGGRFGDSAWALIVLDGIRVRYFAGAAGAWRELATYQATEPDGVDVALAGDGGYFVLLRDPATGDGSARRLVYYGRSGKDVRRVMELVTDDPAWGLATVPASWGERDVAVLNWTGVSYYSWNGAGWGRNYSRDIWGTFLAGLQRQGRGYAAEAWAYSRIQSTDLPVGRVRVLMEADVPEGTAVEVAVTTDGGVTWTPVPAAENTDVPPGTGFGYRLRLATRKTSITPVIDRVEVRQVVYRDVPARVLGRQVQVRLVR